MGCSLRQSSRNDRDPMSDVRCPCPLANGVRQGPVPSAGVAVGAVTPPEQEGHRRKPWLAGNAAFSALAQIAQLAAVPELPADLGSLLRHSP